MAQVQLDPQTIEMLRKLLAKGGKGPNRPGETTPRGRGPHVGQGGKPGGQPNPPGATGRKGGVGSWPTPGALGRGQEGQGVRPNPGLGQGPLNRPLNRPLSKAVSQKKPLTLTNYKVDPKVIKRRITGGK